MGSNNGINVGMGARELEGLMGVEGGSLGPVAWLVIQEEANGTKRGDIAKALNVALEDVEAMIHSICDGADQDESENVWSRGIVALKTAAMLTKTMLRNGWDTVEALALQKLTNQLNDMKGNGDAEQMLRIASTANKSLRRGAGESASGGRAGIGAGAEVAVDLTLQSGSLGRIQLRLSERIKEQLQSPTRTIDVEPRTSNSDKHSMLGLNETRHLLDGTEGDTNEESKLEANKGAFHFDLANGPDVDFATLIQGEDSIDDQ